MSFAPCDEIPCWVPIFGWTFDWWRSLSYSCGMSDGTSALLAWTLKAVFGPSDSAIGLQGYDKIACNVRAVRIMVFSPDAGLYPIISYWENRL